MDMKRVWCVRWVYVVIFIHLIMGALLQWVAGLASLTAYHQSIEQAFWNGIAPFQAREQQIWWISLFGATLQGAAIWMGGLVYLGNKYRCSSAWMWLMLGLLIWAPQDMWISWQKKIWVHIVIDVLALISLLPTLLYLWKKDKDSEMRGDE
jgi:hypothetical protein